MPRARKNNPDLPQHVYFKHGRYYYVLAGKWTALSQDKERAIQAAVRLNAEYGPGWSPELQTGLEKAYAVRQHNAKARKIEFSITLPEVLLLARNNRWRCAVTDLPFSLTKPAGKRSAPFAPSLDRIQAIFGYVPGNVRVVCLAANFAMNEWGDSVMQILAEGWFKATFNRRDLDSPKLDIDSHSQVVGNTDV